MLKIDELIDAIIEDTQSTSFRRTYLDCDFSIVIMNMMNTVLDESPDMHDTVLALSILPALRWLTKASSLDNVIDEVYGSKNEGELTRLSAIQKILTNLTGETPSLMLSKRKGFFVACNELVTLLTNAILSVKEYASSGNKVYKCLTPFLSSKYYEGVSKYSYTNHFSEAVGLVHSYCEGKIEELLDEILFSPASIVSDDPEEAYLYHNMDLLMREYNKIIWEAEISADPSMKILAVSAKKPAELEAQIENITESMKKYSQAYLLVEYVRLITGAIELIKSFPRYGNDYYQILKYLIIDRHYSDNGSDVAAHLGISTSTYYTRRRRAISVLGSVLWGSDASCFMQIVTED